MESYYISRIFCLKSASKKSVKKRLSFWVWFAKNSLNRRKPPRYTVLENTMIWRMGKLLGDLLPVVRQEILDLVDGMIVQAGNDIGQPFQRIHLIYFAGSDKTIDFC